MDPSFGVRLRSVRERQRIALSAIADQTKIKLSLLEALERDDVSEWPRGIFGRSHVRAYAQAVGLDPDAVVGEFLEVCPHGGDEIPAILEAAAQSGGAGSADRPPRARLGLLFDSAIDALHGFRHQRVRAAGGEHVQASAPAAATGKSPDTVPTAGPPADSKPEGPGSAATGVIVREEAHDERTTNIEGELTALAHLCARIGRAHELRDVVSVLEEAVALLDAVGLVLWLGDQKRSFLTPVLALGYSHSLIARLPRVPWDAANVVAAAVRSAETTIAGGSGAKTGAVAVPLVTAAGCVGALAVELPSPGERRTSVRAFASILTAQLAGFFGPMPRNRCATDGPSFPQ